MLFRIDRRVPCSSGGEILRVAAVDFLFRIRIDKRVPCSSEGEILPVTAISAVQD